MIIFLLTNTVYLRRVPLTLSTSIAKAALLKARQTQKEPSASRRGELRFIDEAKNLHAAHISAAKTTTSQAETKGRPTLDCRAYEGPRPPLPPPPYGDVYRDRLWAIITCPSSARGGGGRRELVSWRDRSHHCSRLEGGSEHERRFYVRCPDRSSESTRFNVSRWVLRRGCTI